MTAIRRSAPVNLTVYYPETSQGMEELARRAADAQAEAVNRRLKQLNCPRKQKLELLDALIHTLKQSERERAR